MHKLVPLLSCFALFVACSDDESKNATTTPGTDGGVSDAATATDSATPSDGGTGTDATNDVTTDTAKPYVEPTCNLIDDSGGPGQYNDGCVKREWIAPYAGKYTSATCELTIDVTGSVAATLTIKVTGATLPGTYTNDWEGGGGVGNDSYYRFTTDTTYATTKTLNFAAGKALGTGNDESTVTLRVENLDVDGGAPVYKGRYAEAKGGNDTEVDCGSMTKQ